MVGHKVVGCVSCGSPNSDACLKENKFVPLFTKEELAQQFADQLRSPDILLREYRDVTVFLWVLGAFDKQKKTLDERIVGQVEQRDKTKSVGASSGGSVTGTDRVPKLRDSRTADGTGEPASDGNKK